MSDVIDFTKKRLNRWTLEQALYFCRDMIEDCEDEEEMMRSDVETNIYHLKLLYDAVLDKTGFQLEVFDVQQD